VAETIGLEADGGSGLELNADLDEVERFVICMVTEMVSPVPTDAGEAVSMASRQRLVHDGAAPDMVKPFCEETVTDEKLSVESEADATGTTPMLKITLSSGSNLLEVEPAVQPPPDCKSSKLMEPAETEFTHQPAGGTVAALKEYFVVSMLKVIDRMFLVGPLFVTVTGMIACGSAITTSEAASTVSEKVSAKAVVSPAKKHIGRRAMSLKVFMASSSGL
jgi:hypothetical protein